MSVRESGCLPFPVWRSESVGSMSDCRNEMLFIETYPFIEMHAIRRYNVIIIHTVHNHHHYGMFDDDVTPYTVKHR